MKKILLLFIFFLPLQEVFALHIREVSLSNVSGNAVNISIYTEAVELYYFHSWQYSVLDNTITIDAFYVSGFGSAIAYLNNNFEIPIDTSEAAQYRLIIKIYYINLSIDYADPLLQDEFKAQFETPFNGITPLSIEGFSKSEPFVYPNPTDGKLYVSGNSNAMAVFDKMGREIMATRNFSGIIDLSALEDGIYFIALFGQQKVFNKRVILKK